MREDGKEESGAPLCLEGSRAKAVPADLLVELRVLRHLRLWAVPGGEAKPRCWRK